MAPLTFIYPDLLGTRPMREGHCLWGHWALPSICREETLQRPLEPCSVTARGAPGHSEPAPAHHAPRLCAEAGGPCPAVAGARACFPGPWSQQPMESALSPLSCRSIKVSQSVVVGHLHQDPWDSWALRPPPMHQLFYKSSLADSQAAVGEARGNRLFFSAKDHIVSVLMTPLGTAARKQPWTVHNCPMSPLAGLTRGHPKEHAVSSLGKLVSILM